VLLGDDEQEPVPARIVSLNEATDIITLEVLFNEQHTAVAKQYRRSPLRAGVFLNHEP
jgi:hypothetical protein